MKKIFLLLLTGLFTIQLSAQPQTVIRGKILSNPPQSVWLTITSFDVKTMRNEISQFKADVLKDSTFIFLPDKIIPPITSCLLIVYDRNLKILLSPGDSIHVTLDYWSMQTSAEFSGRGSGKNDYLKQHYLRFTQNDRLDDSQTMTTGYASFLKSLWGDQKVLLNSYLIANQIDTLFLNWESKRIYFDYCTNLLKTNSVRKTRDEETQSAIGDVLNNIDTNDPEALTNYKEYRQFLIEHIEYKIKRTADKKISLQDRISKIDSELQGLSKTFCSFEIIRNTINDAHDSREKKLIKKYFINNSNDQELVRLIESIQFTQSGKNWIDSTKLTRKSLSFLISMTFFILLFIIISRLRRSLEKRGKHLHNMVYVKYLIYFICLVIAISYLRHNLNSFNKFLPILRVITIFGFVIIQVLWLIPRYFIKKKSAWYGFHLFNVSGFYFLSLFLIGGFEHKIFPGFQWLQSGSISFIFISWLILVPFSFIYYFVHLSIKESMSIVQVYKLYRPRRETLSWISIVWLMLFRIFSGDMIDQEKFQILFVFILGITLFFIYAFWIAPRFIMQEKIGNMVLICCSVLIGTAFILHVKSSYEVFLDISRNGLSIPWTHYILPPEEQDLKLAFWLQLLGLPAILYAYERKNIVKKIKGFTLFRKKEAELNQLRSQVNPHFLFNSLNTVYAFALKENNPKTAEYIAKLASLMRYSIEDMEKESIPVEKEVEYIRDYINLQKIRSSVEHEIELEVDIQDPEYQIAPMLMIPFVENAFKHGMNPNKISQLKILIHVKEKQFRFEIENPVDKNFEAFYKEKGFGIGIENVRQRLELIYPARHSISVNDSGDHFIVGIRIDH